MTDDDVRGSWTLVSWMQIYDDGRVVEPYGPDPRGRLLYADGAMCCVMARRERAVFRTGGQWTADVEEKARAYGEVTAYTGTYEVVGDEVIHHVDTSLFPNWEGGSQRRHVTELGDTLRLTARLEEGTSEARLAVLEWRR